MKNNKKCPVGTEIQTILFSKDSFTEKSAKSWAEHNDMKYGKTDIKENTIRIRQTSPFQYKKDSFRTIELTDGVKAVIGCPINSGTIKKPKFVSGGNVKFVTGDDKYKTTWGRKGMKGDSNSVGSFDIRHNGKTWDGYLFELDEFDKEYYSHLPLKDGEKLYRYTSYGTDIGDYFPVIKVNVKKGLVYFLEDMYATDDKNLVFESVGVKPLYISLADTEKMADGGGIDEEDLFDNWESLPTNVREVLEKYSNEDNTYDSLRSMEAELKPLGYTFEWGLDAEPYGLKKIMKDGGGVGGFKKGYVVKLKNKSIGESGYIQGYDGTAKLLEDKPNEYGMIKAFYFGEKGFNGVTAYVGKDDIEKIIKYNNGGGVGDVMARGGFVSKGEMVWNKLTSSKRAEFLQENFTPEITQRSQETLVGKAYNFLPKNVKIKIESKYSNVEEGQYAKGGGVGSVYYQVNWLENEDVKNKSFKSLQEAREFAKKVNEKSNTKNVTVFNKFKFDNGGGVEDKTKIASEIIKQLGGMSRLNIMTGAYNFVALPNGVTFRLKNPKANYVKITLTSMDLYDLEVGRIRGDKYTIVDKKEGLYNDMLKPAIEKATGMYLSLANGGGVEVSKYEKDKLSNMAYQLQNADEGWINNNPNEFIKMQNEYKEQFTKVYGHSNYKDPYDIVEGKFENGGGVESTEQSLNKMIEKSANEVAYLKERKYDLENNVIKPHKIIGKGFKPQYARKLAFEWLNENILKNENDLLFKQELLKSFKDGNNIILYNIDGKGVIRETEHDGYITVDYINGMHSAYKKETLDKIKSEFNPIVEETKVIEAIETVIPVNLPTREETIEAIDGLRVMLDIEPENNEYKNGIRNLKNYLDTLPKESFADLNNPQNINGFIYKPTGDIIRPSIYQDFNINYDDGRILSIELWGQENVGMHDMYKIKRWNSDVIGDLFNGDEQVTVSEKFEQGAEVLIGGKADYMSLSDIAEMHKVSIDHILRQAKMGMKVEREHTSDTNKIIEIVKDHLYESPDYYTKLQAIESSFENGGGVEVYWIDVPSEHNTMFFVRSMADIGGIRKGLLQDNGMYRYSYPSERNLDTAIVILNQLQNPNYNKDMPKNLSQLKNYIEVGTLLRVGYNKNKPEWKGNIKVVVQTQTNGFYLMDGVDVPSDTAKKSWLEYPKTNFISFSPFGFTIYALDYKDKSKMIKFLQYEYVTGEQEIIAKNIEKDDTLLFNEAIKMNQFVDKVYDLSNAITFDNGGQLTPCMFDNKLDYNFDNESASCFINSKSTGRMLILRRADEDFKGMWSLMSGGVELGETPDETIKREIQEELGVNLIYDSLIYLDSTKHTDRTHHYFELSVNEEFEPTLNDENDAYMWINMSELPNNTHPLLKKYIKNDVFI